MGLFRKVTSISTLGIVPYHNGQEKTARTQKRAAKYAKQTRNAARVGAVAGVVGVVQNHSAAKQAIPSGPMPTAPAGWYPDPTDPRRVCWWDGFQWHPETQRWT